MSDLPQPNFSSIITLRIILSYLFIQLSSLLSLDISLLTSLLRSCNLSLCFSLLVIFIPLLTLYFYPLISL